MTDGSRALVIRGVSKTFGGLAAVQDVDLTLAPGRVTALIGPNGAGKTTLFNLVTGHLRPDRGEVRLGDGLLSGRTPFRIARLGIARSFQDLQLFDSLSVLDNVLAAPERSSWFWQPGGGASRRARREAALSALERTGLTGLAATPARDLAYAERKFLSLARVIGQDAPIWLLDEPASGLDPVSRRRFVALLRQAAQGGTTICLVEHSLDIVVELADRIVFLDGGRKLAEGEPGAILSDPALADIYFGTRR